MMESELLSEVLFFVIELQLCTLELVESGLAMSMVSSLDIEDSIASLGVCFILGSYIVSLGNDTYMPRAMDG